MQPKTVIRHAPDPAGQTAALFFVEAHQDIYGWYAVGDRRELCAAFFMIENFYSESATVLYRSREDDVYGPWSSAALPAASEVRCPLPEPVRHELERIQSMFVEEWLFFRDDPSAAAEIAHFHEQRLPLRTVNVRSRRLNRLSHGTAEWSHLTPGCDGAVADFLRESWRFGENPSSR